MKATIEKDGQLYAHDYQDGVPRVGDTILHQDGVLEVQGIVEKVIWISSSALAGNRMSWMTIVRLVLR